MQLSGVCVAATASGQAADRGSLFPQSDTSDCRPATNKTQAERGTHSHVSVCCASRLCSLGQGSTGMSKISGQQRVFFFRPEKNLFRRKKRDKEMSMKGVNADSLDDREKKRENSQNQKVDDLER